MGPQLYRCGNRRHILRKEQQPPASMGPQLYRCGNEALQRDTALRQQGFNGAATLSLRKHCSPHGRHVSQPLASMGPQLYRCGNEPWPPSSHGWQLTLQWGRNFIVAETNRGFGCHASHAGASMGPQLYRCGNLPCLPRLRRRDHLASMGPQLYRCGNLDYTEEAQRDPYTLQWGRNFIVAETRCPAPRSTGRSSFNVAATLSLRKPFHQMHHPVNGLPLQWGRNFIVAETWWVTTGRRHDIPASMGPQLYRCGNSPPRTATSGK